METAKRKTRTFFNVLVPHYIDELYRTVKVIVALWLVAANILAVMYLSNFKLELVKNVKMVEIVSPIQAEE